MTLIGWIYNALVRFKPGSADPQDLEPDLAERWDISADGKAWTFHLRKSLKFQGDWGELTADDVVYSLTRAADPKRSTFSADFAGVESVAKLDDDTVRITLKYPDASFLGRVSSYHGGIASGNTEAGVSREQLKRVEQARDQQHRQAAGGHDQELGGTPGRLDERGRRFCAHGLFRRNETHDGLLMLRHWAPSSSTQDINAT
jgi:ABC-type transport system substrate-binding protein